MLLALLTAAQAVASPPTLAPFKPLVGSCWRASFSATTTDTHCFEAMYGGAHIRDRHEVKEKGNTVYAGETIYSVDGPDLVFTYVNSLGGVGLGKVGSTDRSLGFTGTLRASPDKPEQPIDSEWKLLSPDSYEVQSMIRTKSDKLPPALTFRRVKRP